IRDPLRRVRRRGFERASWNEALDEAEQGLRGAGGSVVVALSGGETVEQAAALARLAQEGLGSRSALLPETFHPALDRSRGSLAAIRDADVSVVFGDHPVVERAPLVDLWLRAARRRGGEVITINPAGTVPLAPGSAAAACAALTGNDPPKELK